MRRRLPISQLRHLGRGLEAGGPDRGVVLQHRTPHEEEEDHQEGTITRQADRV